MAQLQLQQVTVQIEYVTVDATGRATISASPLFTIAAAQVRILPKAELEALPGEVIIALRPLVNGRHELFRHRDHLAFPFDAAAAAQIRGPGVVKITYQDLDAASQAAVHAVGAYALAGIDQIDAAPDPGADWTVLLLRHVDNGAVTFSLGLLRDEGGAGIEPKCAGCLALDPRSPGYAGMRQRCLHRGCAVGTV